MGLNLLDLCDVVKNDNDLAPIIDNLGLELHILSRSLPLEDKLLTEFIPIDVHFGLDEIPESSVLHACLLGERIGLIRQFLKA